MKAGDLISLASVSRDDVRRLLDIASALKREVRAGHHRPILAGKTVALLFEKPSLRTRVSFDVGMAQLGGRAIYLSPDEVGLGRRESVPDVARVLSRFADAIVLRAFAHENVEVLARWASVPIINGLSDYSHPCQALADYLTIEEHLGRLAGLKLAYVGDGNNVANSLLFAGAKLGVNLSFASPRDYAVSQRALDLAREDALATGCEIEFTDDPTAAVRGADVVYTDVWTSMGQESEAERRRTDFAGFLVDSALMARAKPTAIFMHDLPAHRGDEVTADVIDGPQSVVFDQAENRMHAQKGVLVWLLARDAFGEGGSPAELTLR